MYFATVCYGCNFLQNLKIDPLPLQMRETSHAAINVASMLRPERSAAAGSAGTNGSNSDKYQQQQQVMDR